MNGSEVYVWSQCTASLSQEEIHTARQNLSPGEVERCDRFAFEDTRRDFIAAHSLLRQALTAYDRQIPPQHWRFITEPMGKPVVAEDTPIARPLHFNISHTKGFVACAVSSVAVGIDIERIKPETEALDIAERFFSPKEHAALKALSEADRAARFIELWTLKEAYLKGLGMGISEHLQKIVFDLQTQGPVCIAAPEDCSPHAWKFALTRPRINMRLAIAVQTTTTPTVFHNEVILPARIALPTQSLS